jgi:hypothetical protein
MHKLRIFVILKKKNRIKKLIFFTNNKILIFIADLNMEINREILLQINFNCVLFRYVLNESFYYFDP